MICENCKKEIAEGSNFCVHCGHKVSASKEESKNDQSSEIKNKKRIKIAAIIIAVLIVVGGIGGFAYYSHMTKQIAAFSQYASEFEKVEKEYALGNEADNYDSLRKEADNLINNKKVSEIAGLMDRMETLKLQIIKMNEEVAEYKKIYEGFNSRVDEYIWQDSDRERCKEMIEDLEIALEAFDSKESKKYSEKLEKFEKGIKKDSIETVEAVRAEIENFDKRMLYEAEQIMLGDLFDAAEKERQQEKFATAYASYGKCMDILDVANATEYYGLTLEQVDETNYPTTKLYLKVVDFDSGDIVDYFDGKRFSIWEKNGKKYKEKKIKKSSIMNEIENLNIGMVADVSASMGYDMYVAEDAMNDLISSMQFGIGDRAALYSFADTVAREQYFTDKEEDIKNAIYGLQQGNMTAFYDALAFSLSEIIVQDGAKCIIAFTDGKENYSVSSKSYVIQKAQQYKVPIYLIGIGTEVDSAALEEISWQTGGIYRNISSVADMSAIYQTIYREQKARYVLEYDTTKKLSANKERIIYVNYNDGSNVVRMEAAYVPSDYTIDGFIFYDSDSRYLTEDDLAQLTEAEVRIALNEIYARRGYIFQKAEDMKAHFSALDWYHPTEADMSKVEATFNKYERKNVDLLVNYEIAHQLNGRIK